MKYFYSSKIKGSTLHLLFFLFFSVFLNANTKIDPTYKQSFSADREMGYIGYHKNQGYDNPKDNLFSVTINQDINPESEAWLVYDVKGVADASSVTRSINDRLSTGGKLINLTQNWSKQREKINPSWLTKGKNQILFSSPELSHKIGYQIKNLKIEFSSSKQDQINLSTDKILINQGHIHFKGFLSNSLAKEDQLYFNGQKVNISQGEFEVLTTQFAVRNKLELITKDGLRIEKFLEIEKINTPFQLYPKEYQLKRVNKLANKSEKNTIHLEGASLLIENGDLKMNQEISITALRYQDIPSLEMGMVNVTEMHSGYRFLPHGKLFDKEARLAIKVDKKKLPLGYTLNDVKTFFFDGLDKTWKALKRDSIDYKNGIIYSRTTHFTDMINGVIKAPESPETAGYAPTQMSELKAADPLSAVQLISPPTINDEGSANIGYSIEVPPGKQGMQPQLNFSYSSEAGNGWMGLGWDLSTLRIKVDTRWGVPRFDQNQETETYSLSGAMLVGEENGKTFLAHRELGIPRRADRLFYPRIEGSFNKIVRKGDRPTNYTWEVTDPSGTKYYYGTQKTAILQDPISQHIAEWYLTKVEDVNGNTMTYEYDVVEKKVFSTSNDIKGRVVYLKEIHYTGKGADKGMFSIEFIRDRTVDRKDNTNSARYGFFTINPELLSKVVVRYGNETVRSYHLKYITGAFNQEVLTEIAQQKPNGEEFYHHQFSYYTDVENQAPIYSKNNIEYDLKKDGLNAGLLSSSILGGDYVTALGGGKSTSYGINSSLSAGVFNGDALTRSGTIGAQFNYNSSTSQGISVLVDINGDGLPDKVFVKNGQMYYRPNLSQLKERTLFFSDRDIENRMFGNEIAVEGGPQQFSMIKSSSTGFGAAAYIGFSAITATAGLDKNSGTNTTKTYFLDVNSDGLIDIVHNGQVYFNSIRFNEKTGELIPVFSLDSNKTPNPINGGGKIDSSVYTIDPKEQEELIKNSPLHDVVRLWEAPFDGSIHIQSVIKMQTPKTAYDQEEYEKADGVYVQVQQNGNVISGSSPIKLDKGTEKRIDLTRNVKKGDRIYFRVQSGLDDRTANGAFDLVHWDPEISYTQLAGLNQEDLKNYVYQASKAFIVEADVPNLVVQKKGEKGAVEVIGHFLKPISSDELTIRIEATDETGKYKNVWLKKFKSTERFEGELSAVFELPALLDQQKEHAIKIHFESPSNLNWKDIKWDAELRHYKQGDYTIERNNNSKRKIELDTRKYSILFTPNELSSLKYDQTGKLIALEDRAKWVPRFEKYDNALSLANANVEVKKNGEKTYLSIRKDDYTGGDLLMRSLGYIYKGSENNQYFYPYHDPVFVYAGVFPSEGFYLRYSKYGNLMSGTAFYEFSDPNKLRGKIYNLINTYNQKLADLFQPGEPIVIVSSFLTGMRIYKNDGTYFYMTGHTNYNKSSIFSGYGTITFPNGKTEWRGPGNERFDFDMKKGSAFEFYGMGAIGNDFVGGSPRPLADVEKDIQDFIDYTGIFDSKDSADPSSNQTVTIPKGAKPDYTGIPTLHYVMYTQESSLGKTFKSDGRNQTINASFSIHINKNVSGKKIVTFTLKSKNNLVALLDKKEILIDLTNTSSGDQFIPVSTSLELNNQNAAEVFVEAFIDANLGEIQSANYTVQKQSYPLAVYQKRTDYKFGGMYLNWGQFSYNSANGRATKPIDENQLKLNSSTDQMPKNNDQLDSSKYEENFQNQVFIPMSPNLKKNSNSTPFVIDTKWQGLDPYVFIVEEFMSSSRLGEKDVVLKNPLEGIDSGISGGAAFGIDKITKTSGLVSMIGAGPFTGSRATGTAKVKTDFFDLNGDGYPDIVVDNTIQYTNPLGGFSGQTITYDGGNHESKNEGYTLSAGGAPIKSESSLTAERKTHSSSATVGKDKGTDKAKNNSTIPTGGLSGNYSKEETAATWLDVNGDGLPDKVLSNSQVMFNTGYGFTNPVDLGIQMKQKGEGSSLGAGLGFSFGGGSFVGGVGLNLESSNSTVSFSDVNGDGLPDLIWNDGQSIKVRLNEGSKFSENILTLLTDSKGIGTSESLSESANAGGTFSLIIPSIPPVKISVSTGGNTAKSVNRSTVQITDIDGDGYADYVVSSEEDKLLVKRSSIGRTNRLKTVTNPVNGTFTIDYAHSPASYYHPRGKWVMSALEVEAIHGIAKPKEIGTTRLVSIFSYDQGRYNRREREFLGFGKIRTHQLDGEKVSHSITESQRKDLESKIYRTSEQEYAVIRAELRSPATAPEPNYYSQGLKTSTKLYAKDNQDQLYTSSHTEYYDNWSKKQASKGFIKDQGIFFKPVKYTSSSVYEGDKTNEYHTEESYFSKYDDYGHPLEYLYSNTGNLKTSTFGKYNYQTSIKYANNLTDHILGMATSVEVTTQDEGLVRKTEADYDQSKGRIKTIRNYLDQSQVAVTDLEYNEDGNLVKKTLPANSEGKRMYYSYDYDKYGFYVKGVRDAFGYESYSGDYGVNSNGNYDYRYGIALQNKDINGNETKYEIDELGRIKRIIGPNELFNHLPYTLEFEYHPFSSHNNHYAYSITRHYDEQNEGDDIETITYCDGLGRTIQVKKDGLISELGNAHKGEGTIKDREVLIVSGRMSYDGLGRIKSSYQPMVEELSTDQSKINLDYDQAQKPVETTYDVLDRPILVQTPQNGVYVTTQTEYSIGEESGEKRMKVKVTDALGNKKEVYTKGGGLTTKTVEEGNIQTSYHYDGINQLREVTDTKGNSIQSTYDLFGRRTRVTHPDAGTTTLSYDLVNLIHRQTANLGKLEKSIDYEYDYTRLVGVNYPEHPKNNVRYYYGNYQADNNRKGKLILLEDATGATEYSYGRQGEITQSVRTLIIPNNNPATFTSKWRYDSWNRLQEMTFSDGEKVVYHYNTGGLLESVKGYGAKSGTTSSVAYHYVDKIGYDKFDQRTFLRYGNGTQTIYHYEPDSRRLGHLQGFTGSESKRLFMDNHYTYDKVSNILKLENQASQSNNEIGGSITHSYQYDNLYRLTSAKGSYKGVESSLGTGTTRINTPYTASYDLMMKYDELHNIVTKKQTIKRSPTVDYPKGVSTGYELSYQYQESFPHQVKELLEESYREEDATPQGKEKESRVEHYHYDSNGNVEEVNTTDKDKEGLEEAKVNQRKLLWDEENRLKAISDNGFVSYYSYDSTGERVLKQGGNNQGVYVNNDFSGGNTQTNDYTLYVSPYMVVKNGIEYSKHIYIESQRVITKLGDGSTYGLSSPLEAKKAGDDLSSIHQPNWSRKIELSKQEVRLIYDSLKVPYHGEDKTSLFTICPRCNPSTRKAGEQIERMIYYYHPDHLGSSSYISDSNGDITQHLEYVPFGEVFLEERNGSYNTRYKFNGKELDEETGLYYYGARYYNPKTSLWLSVDPLADYNPLQNTEHYIDGQHNGGVYNSGNLSPYAYTYNNPIRYIDPNGKQVDFNKIFDNISKPFKKMFNKINEVQVYSLILSSETNNCGSGGCQSWFNSNYIGASNLKNITAEKQRATGSLPVDEVDLGAYNHDVDYDEIGASGFKGALLELKTLDADIKLLESVNKVLEKAKRGEKDIVTGKKISLATYARAKLVSEAFKQIVDMKKERLKKMENLRLEVKDTDKIQEKLKNLSGD